jgi:hypothetical protein
MKTIMKILAGGAGLAAAAAPANAQYYGNPGYARPYSYGSQYGYGGVNTNVAAQQCTSAVQSRLYNRSSIGGIIGSFLGTNTTGRVVSVTQVVPRGNTIRVRGLASSGRYAGYSPYGVGAYGALGYNYQPDLSFKCDVDFRGYVRNVDINRR